VRVGLKWYGSRWWTIFSSVDFCLGNKWFSGQGQGFDQAWLASVLERA
jgi:hypothetical protein